jgi:hypothetical protein
VRYMTTPATGWRLRRRPEAAGDTPCARSARSAEQAVRAAVERRLRGDGLAAVGSRAAAVGRPSPSSRARTLRTTRTHGAAREVVAQGLRDVGSSGARAHEARSPRYSAPPRGDARGRDRADHCTRRRGGSRSNLRRVDGRRDLPRRDRPVAGHRAPRCRRWRPRCSRSSCCRAIRDAALTLHHARGSRPRRGGAPVAGCRTAG